jgi:O-antigen/teichoic acid export membrane protein
VYGYLKRLVTAGAAYQLGEIVAKAAAIVLLPVYTRHLTRADYGTVDLIVTLVILVSFVVRLGLVEAFLRYYFVDTDPARRDAIARSTTGAVLWTTTVVAGTGAILAGPLSELVLGYRDVTVWLLAMLGLWAYTNMEMAQALLRADERTTLYLRTSLINVALTITLSVSLVVGRDAGARGLIAGNFVATTVVLLVLWWILRERLGLRPDRDVLSPLLRFGLPTVPAEVSVFALNLVDRGYLYRVQSQGKAGLYSLAVKLAAVVIFATRAFQYAWPPLAYSVEDDNEAARLYAVVATYYVLVTGTIVAAVTLLGRWALRLLATDEFFKAHEALPWVALGWGLYGLFLVLIVVAGRAQVTTRNFPAAIAGLAVNVVLLVTLVPALGIAGAGIALCGAYLAMLALMHMFTRRLFPVAFEWARLAQLGVIIGGVAVAGELVLPDAGVTGFLTRGGALLAIPVLLVVTRFFSAGELARARGLVASARARLG